MASFPDMIERGPLDAFDFFKVGRAQARHFFELGTQMLGAAVSQPVGYLTECQFIIYNQFLDFLDFLKNDILFDRNSLNRREERAQA